MVVNLGQSINSPQNGTYYVNDKMRKEWYNKEDHIIENIPLTGAKSATDKFMRSLLVYTPKGLKGSVNSNFYEFLSMGAIPYVVGSATLIALSNLANKFFRPQDAYFANKAGKNMAAGVLLYGLFKWAGKTVMNKMVERSTGIDLDLPYKKNVHNLPETKNDKNLTSVEFHKVFESVDFPRWDLIEKSGDSKNDRYYYYDKITKKMGYKDKLNSPDQIAQPKIKEVVSKTKAAGNISSYLWAATGVALGAQKPFVTFFEHFGQRPVGKMLKTLPKCAFNTVKNSFIDLVNGPSKKSNFVGRILVGASLLSTVFGWANAIKNFKAKEHKTEIDFNKNFKECR
ncbi:MAG: hypothetical protein E7Z93_06940 [Cyanobacteria bacterium SIG32]|nr:hypothetical protein [Cyanobacteria bacterium SIG32]